MALSYELISQFAKVINSNKKQSTESTVYGTVVTDNSGNKYVKLDGSDQLTPLTDENRPDVDTSTATADKGDRVSVLIKDHTATVTGNVSSPSVQKQEFDSTVSEIKEFDTLIGDKVQTNEGYIKQLETDKANVGDLTAATARIAELEADNVTINESLTAANAEITSLKTTKLDADTADLKFATIDNLQATTAKVDGLSATHAEFETATANKFTAMDATIKKLDAEKITAEQIEGKYANIDFTNISEAAVEKIFSDSGIIKDLVVSEGHITGELVGVTIKGDLIEAGTLKADRLVVKGSDGIYYKLNIESGATTSEEVSEEDLQNGLHGDAIIAHTITAEKIQVDDLIAFGATIGSFNIGTNSLYSGVKESIDNTTRGIYFDTDGQAYIGDANNYLKFYKDSDGNYKLAISAESMIFSSSKKTVTEVIDEVTNLSTRIGNLEVNNESIVASVSTIETLNNKINDVDENTNSRLSYLEEKAELTLTEDAVNIQIDKKLQNGVDKVETSTGFRFDDEGLSISKSGTSIETQITENGMYVNNHERYSISDYLPYTRITMGGEEVAEDFYCSRYYIPITSPTITFINDMSSDTGYNVFYDEYQIPITTFSNATGTVEVPSNAVWFKLSWTNNANLEVFASHDTMLTANKDGVDAKNLRATTYLIIGNRSRFENYGDDRTGCFWIGG